ncbi:MAG: hypothetical protein MJ061_05205, partial [Mailhella sp.]|nr:hypothetical protein [Mailhella sp.]
KPMPLDSSGSDAEFMGLLNSSKAMRNADYELGSIWKSIHKNISKSELRELLYSQRNWVRYGRRMTARQYMRRGYGPAAAYTIATDERIDTIRSFFAKQQRQYVDESGDDQLERHSSILGLPIDFGMPKEVIVALLSAAPSPSDGDALTVSTTLFGKDTEVTLNLDSFVFVSKDYQNLSRMARFLGIRQRIVSRTVSGESVFTFEERPAWLAFAETGITDRAIQNRLFEHFCRKYRRITRHDDHLFDADPSTIGNTGVFIAKDRYLYCSSTACGNTPMLNLRYIDKSGYDAKSRCTDLYAMVCNGDISIALYENGSFCGFPWGTPLRDIIMAFPGRTITAYEDSICVRLLSYPYDIEVSFIVDEDRKLLWGDFSFSSSMRGIGKHMKEFFASNYTAIDDDPDLDEFVNEVFGRKTNGTQYYTYSGDCVIVTFINASWHIIRGLMKDIQQVVNRRRSINHNMESFIESELDKF